MRPRDSRTLLSVFQLEDRAAPAAAELTAGEQYFLELLNRARANPAAEAARLAIDLNEGLPAGTISPAPQQPLAPDPRLQSVIAVQLAYQPGSVAATRRLTHTGADGSSLGTRVTAAGYSWTGVSENLAYRSDPRIATEQAMADTLHAQLVVDAGVDGRGHRTNVFEPRFRDAGTALLGDASRGEAVYTGQDFGNRAGNPTLTGVAYTDAVTADRFYGIGEGVGGVTVTAVAADGRAYSTTTTAAGGYALDLPAGAYTVTFAAPTGATETHSVTLGSTNLKLDFVPTSAPAVPPVPVNTAPLPVAVVAGGVGTVRVIDPATGATAWQIAAAVPAGIGARVAAADVTGDGIDDVIVGTGPGTGTRVRVFDGSTQAEIHSFQPFESAFRGGVYVAAGDVTGDGRADLIVTPDEGGGPRVDVYSGGGFGKVASFFGIDDANFRGGARAAVGDVTGDGRVDLVVAAGFAGGPRVAGFDGTTVAGGRPAKAFADFYAFEQALRNGVFVAAGDVDGDGKADVVVGGGPGGGPRVTTFRGADLLAGRQTVISNFFGGDPANRGGIRVAVKDATGDGRAELLVGAASQVTAYAGGSITNAAPGVAFDVNAFPGFTGGVYVG